MYLQTIVCFANSRKEGRRCVAGKTWLRSGGGAWVRPVSCDSSRALSMNLLAYKNGVQPTLLDIVQVPMQAPLPEGHQSENYLVAEGYYWEKAGQLRWEDIDQWVDAPEQLWTLDSQSLGMLNNRVDSGVLVQSSLELIRVPTVLVRAVFAPVTENSSRHIVVGDFVYHGVNYRLHVTDSQIEAHCRSHIGQTLEISDAVLCVSLGACFRDYYYKLIASVIYDRRIS